MLSQIDFSQLTALRGRRVLVTGGAGFIGQWLVRALLQVGAHVRVADNLWRGKRENLCDRDGRLIIPESDFLELDLRDPDNCRRACEGIETVFHLADIVAGIGWVFANERRVYHENTLINTLTFAAAQGAGVRALIFVGTACSYPKALQVAGGRPLREEEAYPAAPESAYGWSKLMGEYEAGLLAEDGMNVAVLRLHNVYGPGADYSPERSQVIPSLVRKALRYPDEPFLVWGSGNQARAFVYVGDVVDGILRGAVHGLNQGVIQIGVAEHTTIRFLAEEVVRLVGRGIEIQYDTSKPEGDAGRCADWTKAKQVLGWSPKTSLSEGLAAMIEWMREDLSRRQRR